ncbi:MAG: DUF354 domain-containing protein [Euryarchaeota archaeon]|nr:DUF354 domain-containing protein [Euryarchaeota archaeon]
MLWVDVTNLPHVPFFERFIKERRCFVTARRHGFLEEMLRARGISFVSVGKHARGRREKLIASARRIIQLARVLESRQVSACIAKHSVEAPRVAFGLGIPHYHFVDNEYAEHQNRLTLSLCTRIIAPEATDRRMLLSQGAEEGRLLSFRGVLEVAQVRNFKPDDALVRSLKLRRFVLLRPPPEGAAYYQGRRRTREIIEVLRARGYTVVLIPRGDESYPGCITLRNVDTLSLAYHAEAVVSEGGTMNREAALLGTPAISLYRGELLGVDRYLIKLGLMRHASSAEELLELLPGEGEKEELRECARKEVARMEDPFEVLARAMGERDK